jgi:hypothetical protein
VTKEFVSPGETGDSEALDTAAIPDNALWCINWEAGHLEQAGYEGEQATLYDGAIVFLATEGGDFSALRGEEKLDLGGRHALGLRSSEAGDTSSVAIATTPFFTAEAPQLWWRHLSEADERGVVVYADLMAESGAVLASLDYPPQTGGFVPGLAPGQESIAALPEIEEGEGTPGELVTLITDITPWQGQIIRLRLYQQSALSGQGFFTLVDDICTGTHEELALEWDGPNPDHR